MMSRCDIAALIVLALGLAACSEQRKISTTYGSVSIECDESVAPVLQLGVDDFQRSYKEASVAMRSVEDREAIANFLNDSVELIVSAREFNPGEKDFVKKLRVELQEYKIALDAIAVIAHKDREPKHLRLTELDSIFSGALIRWPGQRGNNVIDIVIGGVNSSTNEVFRETILKGKAFSLSATPMSSTEKLVEYVHTHQNAIGIAGVSWLKGRDEQLTVYGLGDPNSRPDSTQPVGKYYAPVQAHVHRHYYPLWRTVYVYNRSIHKDVGFGFIAYLSSAQGQKVFLNNGLVPVTMPVRLVDITSQQVH